MIEPKTSPVSDQEGLHPGKGEKLTGNTMSEDELLKGKTPLNRLESEEEAALGEVRDLLNVVEDLISMKSKKEQAQHEESESKAEKKDDEDVKLLPDTPSKNDGVDVKKDEQDSLTMKETSDAEKRRKLTALRKRLGKEVKKQRQRVGASLSKLRKQRDNIEMAQRRISANLQDHPAVRRTRDATRKVITGSKDTRVRDFVEIPRVVKVLDIWCFTFGVLGIMSTEYVLLLYPALFRYYLVVCMFPMLSLRYVLYHRAKWHYFLWDFCYWVNGLCFYMILMPPKWIGGPETEELLWQTLFVCANGPLLSATVAWNNSMVFHSLDKVTSLYVHVFPALLSWCERWRSIESSNTSMNFKGHFTWPTSFYFVWQIVYLAQTEVLDRDKLDNDPEIATALRWLTNAPKMTVNRMALKACRSIGIMGPDETFTPPRFKVTLIFVVFQLLYTLVTFTPARLLHSYEYAHTATLILIITFSVYNGARYYIQVFSKIHEKRYSNEKKKPSQPVKDESASSSFVISGDDDF